MLRTFYCLQQFKRCWQQLLQQLQQQRRRRRQKQWRRLQAATAASKTQLHVRPDIASEHLSVLYVALEYSQIFTGMAKASWTVVRELIGSRAANEAGVC